jgi:chromosome segregation ATPase
MSTQFDTPIVDLDRTDELPVLEVEAYEASLPANDTKLSRTDTWVVEGLRAVDELDDESGDAVPAPLAPKPTVQSESLTINVERILRRITELEAQIVASHETNARLQKDCEALGAERTQVALRIEALQADNDRLCRDRAQSDEIARHMEQQLRERGQSVAALQKSLADEKDLAAQLSQQLAAKLMDCEKAGSIIELRNCTIADLTRDGAALNQRLQQEIAASADLTARLAVAEQSLQESHSLLLEHDAAIGKRDAQLVQAQAQIQCLIEERDALRSASAQLGARAADLEQKDAELAQVFGELVAARAEAQGQTMLVKERTDELGTFQRGVIQHETAIREFEHTIRSRGEQVEELMTQLRAALDERTKMGMLLDKARAREKNLTEQIFTRDSQIAGLQADLAVHTEALATIRRDVSRIGNHATGELDEVEHMLEPVQHEGPTLYLTREVLTVGRTSDNDISIPSKLISRCHARLLVGPTGVIIEDADSMNGCYVNGTRVRQHLLHDGDMLELGDMRYRLRTRPVRDRRIQDIKPRQLSSASRRTAARIVN